MAESSVFEWVSQELETRTTLSRLEARGTLRLLLKDFGLDPTSITAVQMQVVVERLLGPALSKRKVSDAEAVCRKLALDLVEHVRQRPVTQEESAYDVFERLDSLSARKGKR